MTTNEILKLEYWLELGFAGVLGEICPNVFNSRDARSAVTPRITVKAVIGEEQEHVFLFPNNQTFTPDTWDAELRVSCATNRTTEQISGAHYELIGQIRSQLQMQRLCPLPHGGLIPAEWSKYQSVILLSSIKSTGTDDSVQDTDHLDQSSFTFSLMTYINPTAWPADPTT